jgi:ATP-dependent Lon protease
MTGEITLRGRALAIGGLKEKLLAAKTAGIKIVLVPKQNEKDVAEIDTEIKSGMDIIFVESMDDVIKYAFSEPIKPLKAKTAKRKTKTATEEK